MEATAHTEFTREVPTYRDTMDTLHWTAAGQRATLTDSTTRWATETRSVTEMNDAVDDYEGTLDAFDAAVCSLHDATADAAPSVGAVAGDRAFK